MLSKLSYKSGWAEEKEKEYERPEGISGREYLSTLKAEDIDAKKRKAQLKNKIAVIHVEGAIVTGNIGFNTAAIKREILLTSSLTQ